MSRDPIEEKDALNLYTFVENNTLNLVDPDGLKVISQSMSIPIPLFIPWPSLEFLGGIQACKDALSAVMTDLIGNAFGWRERFPGKSDHFYHCYHSCKIATACGDNLSMFLGSLRESFQQFLDNEGSLEDMISNVDGITCGKKKCPRPNRVQQCIDCCNNAMGVPR